MMEKSGSVVLIGYRTLNPHLDFVTATTSMPRDWWWIIGEAGPQENRDYHGQQKTSRNASDRLSGFKLSCTDTD